MTKLHDEALEYHQLKGKAGKIEVVPTKPLDTQYDLAMAYTPGVAEPVMEVARDPSTAYEYTSKGNLVAVISNGTAILGLGDQGALASKPVMEGKGVLFKKFADIDVFDIEVNSHSIDEIVNVVTAIAPTFGGINLEDIKAPECFEIERRLEDSLDIPVFHDDQHGTAIISIAGLMNALELVEKDISKVKIVVSGAGASAISCAKMAVLLGARKENITLVDSRGVVFEGRKEGMNPYKAEFAGDSKDRTLAEAVDGSDVFYGLSIGGLLKPEMVKTMAPDPIIFAMANPNPEIGYDEAKKARPDAIVATGRSDYPNQVNNVLGFPFIFRGALDVNASHITDEMKVAASKALAGLAKEDVPDAVLRAYSLESLKFGRDYIIPKPFDPRVLMWVAPAVAQAAVDCGVARREIDFDHYREQLSLRQGKGQQIRHHFKNKAKMLKEKVRIVFPEGEDPKIIRAASQVLAEGIGSPLLLGRSEDIQTTIQNLGLSFDPEIVDMDGFDQEEEYVSSYYEMKRRKGITMRAAKKQLSDRNTFGAMMVRMGDADAMVSGINYEYPEVIRPALQIHHTMENVHRAAGLYILTVADRVLLLADTTVNIDPNAEELAEIAILAADFAKTLDLEPRVAMLSFSNFGSSPHAESNKVRKAVELIREMDPDLAVDGEMQADTAVVSEIVEKRYPFSRVKDANVLVFPSLAAANISTKLLSQIGNAHSIGPILLGIGAPIQVLQTGDDVSNIVNMAAVAALDAAERKHKKQST